MTPEEEGRAAGQAQTAGAPPLVCRAQRLCSAVSAFRLEQVEKGWHGNFFFFKIFQREGKGRRKERREIIDLLPLLPVPTGD